MTTNRQYNSGVALRTSLEERLKRTAHDEAVDLQRLRRQVAFDRFLARLFHCSSEPHSKIVASLASTSSTIASGKLSSLFPPRAPRSSARG